MTMWNLATKQFVLRLRMLVLLVAVPLLAMATSADSLSKDSTDVRFRQPSLATQQRYATDDYYRYERKKGLEEETFIDRILRSLFESKDEERDPNLPDPDVESVSTGLEVFKYFILLLAVGLLVWGIISAVRGGTRNGKLFSGKTKELEDVDARVEDVDIHAINYEQQIAQARERGDYRYAVRLWFLNTLKQLSDKQLLNWRPEKTNLDYFYELSGQHVQQQFADVTRVYDFVWYGERALNETDYQRAEDQFRTLQRDMN